VPAVQQIVKQEVTDVRRDADRLDTGRTKSSGISGGGWRRLV
jgi:hypothetical protein